MNARRERSTGFTLLELLVAMAIFAIIGALAMGGLNAVIGQRELAAKQLDRLHHVQWALRVITNDFAQLNPRQVRNLLGEGYVQALVSECDASALVCLSRGGWRNPFWRRPRGELQRVQYRFNDGKLFREYWPVMDRILVSEPTSEVLLDDLESVEFNYPDTNGDSGWLPEWSPLSADELPPAIRVSLRLRDWGEIYRIVEIAR